MKYKVVYLKPKKKKGVFTQQTAVLETIEDAMFWKNVVELQGCKETEVYPVF
jgi:hypothetical protein